MIKSLLFLAPAFDGVEDEEPAPESPATAACDVEDDPEVGDTFGEEWLLAAVAGSLVGE